MYFPKGKVLVLEVPKCGSRTLVHAGKLAWGENRVAGHKPLVQAYREITERAMPHQVTDCDKIIRIVRHPIERFVSGLNYETKDKKFKLDYLIDRMLEGKSPTIYKPQVSWCPINPNLPVIKARVYTFPINRMSDALAVMGLPEGTRIWENRSPDIFNIHDVKRHPRYKEILAEYEQDFILWETYKDTTLSDYTS